MATVSLLYVGGGVDYFSGPYLVAFPPGMTTAVISVQINDNALYESDSLNFTLTIISDDLNNNVIIGETNQTTVTIIDDDCKLCVLNKALQPVCMK